VADGTKNETIASLPRGGKLMQWVDKDIKLFGLPIILDNGWIDGMILCAQMVEDRLSSVHRYARGIVRCRASE
jgi:hypothetical protein